MMLVLKNYSLLPLDRIYRKAMTVQYPITKPYMKKDAIHRFLNQSLLTIDKEKWILI
jgi:hypothetical protein